MASIPDAESASTGSRRSPLTDLLLLILRPQSVSPESPTAAWVRRHPVITLVTLAYGLTWIGLIPLIQNPQLSLSPEHISRASVIVAFLGVLGCLWAALGVAGAEGGVKGRYDLLRGYLKWKVGIQWYLVVLLVPALVWLASMGVDTLVFGKLSVVPAFGLAPAVLLPAYGFALARYMIGNFEEIAWRATLQPHLQLKYNALAASLIVGVVQGFWHLPYAFIKGSFVQEIGLPAMVLMSVAMSVVFAWVYINTRSLLMVVIFHAAYDAWSPFQGTDARLAYLSIAVWLVVAITVVVVYGAKQLSRQPAVKIPVIH